MNNLAHGFSSMSHNFNVCSSPPEQPHLRQNVQIKNLKQQVRKAT